MCACLLVSSGSARSCARLVQSEIRSQVVTRATRLCQVSTDGIRAACLRWDHSGHMAKCDLSLLFKKNTLYNKLHELLQNVLLKHRPTFRKFRGHWLLFFLNLFFFMDCSQSFCHGFSAALSTCQYFFSLQEAGKS